MSVCVHTITKQRRPLYTSIPEECQVDSLTRKCFLRDSVEIVTAGRVPSSVKVILRGPCSQNAIRVHVIA